ncbi:hypothetical protein C492_03611 [Natronococcus jeotgali DSM 18795]|uniref:Uncharacterized protein n=2 Tax=Natronococcus jeotgali TaxID=413812 RepID=L9XU86_9EURY|nr:hypothetical protein C492_03611 [Natronococcus jeotgali DSM 18795]
MLERERRLLAVLAGTSALLFSETTYVFGALGFGVATLYYAWQARGDSGRREPSETDTACERTRFSASKRNRASYGL